MKRHAWASRGNRQVIEKENLRLKRRIRRLGKKIRKLEIPHKSSKVSSHITLSIGYATYTPDSKLPPISNDLIKSADEGLYMAKSNGRNQIVKGPDINNQ